MKGYLLVQPVAEIERELNRTRSSKYSRSDFLLDMAASLEGRGFIPLTAAIKEGNVLKLSAEKYRVHYEAQFDMSNANRESNNGEFEIRGGPLTGVGTFIEVIQQRSTGFKLSFICLSSYGDGRSLLKWSIGISDFVDAEQVLTDG